MSTAATLPGPVQDKTGFQGAGERSDQPSGFGRIRWWFEESPMAFTASVALALVTLGFIWLVTMRSLPKDLIVASVSLQPVQADASMNESPQKAPDNAMEFQELPASAGEDVERVEEKVELPDVPAINSVIKPEELLGNQADSDKQLRETDAALRQAGEMLRKLLEANQNRGHDGGAGGGTGTGKGDFPADSTPGRQARWIITYPTLPQGEYERMLDAFRIELAFLQADRKTMQYLSTLAGAGKKYTGDAASEQRMFWYWMGQNRLRELDNSILLKHGLDPTSEVIHLYSKELERRLAQMEREYLSRQWKTTDAERIAQTNFKIVPGGPTGWHIEVTGIALR